MSESSRRAAHGSSLLEAVIAAGLLATVLTGVLPLATTVVSGAAASRADLMAAHLARQRLSQLQVLTHARSASGSIVDLQSRLDTADAFGFGGGGLTPTGLAPLDSSTVSWVDWLDAHGAWQGAGVDPPPTARYRRRWGVLAAGGEGCLRVWVNVEPLGRVAGDQTAHAGGLQCPWGVAAP